MSDFDQGVGALDFLSQLSDGLDQESIELNRKVVNHLFVLLRSAGMHDLENAALDRPLGQMHDVVGQLFERGIEKVEIALLDGNFFINGRLLQLDFSTFQNTRYLRKIFEYLDIGEMVFVDIPTKENLRALLEAFVGVIGGHIDSIRTVDLAPIYVGDRAVENFEGIYGEGDPRHHVLGLYASGLLMLRQFVNDLRKKQAPRYPKIKRLCLQLIDLDPRYHNLLIALTHLEGYKGNLFCHMLNTGILSIAFGKRIGLNRDLLLDLGMTAFYHDLGWPLIGTLSDDGSNQMSLTMDGINKIRNRADPQMDDLRVKVARALVRIGGFNELVISRLIVAYESQIPVDHRPDQLYYGEIGANFMTHIVRLASRYDELTAKTGDREAYRPDEAMNVILDDGGKVYDPFLAKLFVNGLGAYPVGTLVELDTGEVGLVVNLPMDPIHFNRPQVKIVIDRAGQPVNSDSITDLGQKDRSGRFTRTVERTYDARNFGINITGFFFGDRVE
jgi:HD-GYP domain-containing protein (c-di-GMP phosphodiesterase class II)